MPSLELDDIYNVDLSPTSDTGVLFRKIYIQKLGGTFVLSNSSELSQLMSYVNDTIREYGVFDHEFIAMPREGITLFSNIAQQYQQTKVGWNLSMIALLMICFTRFVSLIFQKNGKRYAIMVISGASHVREMNLIESWKTSMEQKGTEDGKH